MARDVESLVLQMSADLRRFDKSMAGMKATADRRLNEVERRAMASQRNLSRIMDRAGTDMVGSFRSSLSALAPTLAAAFSTAQVIKYADAYTSLQNRLKATGLEGEALKRVEDGLYEAANRNGVAVEATASLYQRAAMARENLGASEEQLMQIVSGTSAALKLQGTSAGEASGALLQLGQLLGGNVVQAQEYNSLIDGLPTVLEAVAKGSDRWGGSVNKLTQDVKAGKVTSQEFFQAALKGYADIEARAGQSTTTVGAALQTLNNQLGRFIGQTDSSMSATARMAQAIEWLANNLDTVTTVVGVLAAVMGTRFVLSLTASASATLAATIESVRYQVALAGMAARQAGVTTATVLSTAAMRAFSAAVVANPIGAAVVAVTALAAGLVWVKNTYGDAAVAARQLDGVMTAGNTAIDKYKEAMDKARAASGEERKELLKKAQALREVTAARIEDARVAAQQQINEAVAARREAAEARAQADRNRSRGGTSEGSRSVQFGMDRAAQGAEDFAARTKAQADAALEGWRSLQSSLNAADNPNTGGGGGNPPATPPDGRGASGPSPEDIAAQQRMLALQGQLEVLRAQGNQDAIRAKEREIDLINLTKSYTEAGFANAAQMARDQVAAVAAAEDAVRATAEAERNREGEVRAADVLRQMTLDMLDVQEQLALTDRDALAARREILAIRQAERRVALEAAAADAEATEAERSAARTALANLPTLERGENRQLEGSSEGAQYAQGIVRGLDPYQDAVERAREAYEEIDRLRQEDVISEQEAAMAKAQIDADLREQRLAGTQTMLGALAALQNSSNKKLAALGKAAAIAQATIDGVLAVQKALASAPPPMNFIQAAIVGAVAAANVASIAGMADGGLVRGPGGPREDKVLRRLSAGEFVVNAKATAQNRGLLEALNSGKVPGLANGGAVGRANRAVASLGSYRPPSSSFSYSPTIDARGSDMAAIARLEQVMANERAALPDVVNGIRARHAKYQLGTRRGRA